MLSIYLQETILILGYTKQFSSTFLLSIAFLEKRILLSKTKFKEKIKWEQDMLDMTSRLILATRKLSHLFLTNRNMLYMFFEQDMLDMAPKKI